MTVQLQLFPPKLYLEIFSYLSSDELPIAEKVCKVWQITLCIQHQINDYNIKIGYLTPIESTLSLLQEEEDNLLNYAGFHEAENLRTFLKSITKSQAVHLKYLIGTKCGFDLDYLKCIQNGDDFTKLPTWHWQESWKAAAAIEEFQEELQDSIKPYPELGALKEGLEKLLEKT